MVINTLLNSIVVWGAWIIIPLLMEIIPSIGSFFGLIWGLLTQKKPPKPVIYPEISIMVPVYNSEKTLANCIASINNSSYPNDRIKLFLINNHTKDNSFKVFCECQEKFPTLSMQWMNAHQGKSRALNQALYSSEGKYIINIDSDGILEKDALCNLIDKFEADTSVDVCTGIIMIEPRLIEEYPRGMAKFIRKLEFMEYAEVFLAGRIYDARRNRVYTLSGAFSAFRKSAILKSRLYNTETLAEDTQLTFQMRYLMGEKIYVSENSLFFVDPVENIDKLYTQRQRWQRGSLEVSQMFSTDKLKFRNMFKDVSIKTLFFDHTFAFPRLIWYTALICLAFTGYSVRTILLSSASLFSLYTISNYLFFFSSIGYLREFPEVQSYYKKQWWVQFFLPTFNLANYFIRFAGIINSINTDSAWKTTTLTMEWQSFKGLINKDIVAVGNFFRKVNGYINSQDDFGKNSISHPEGGDT